jgi:hypothetical protein
VKTAKGFISSAALSGGLLALGAPAADAITNIFFNAAQTATVVVSNINAVTLCSGDYLFTYSADGYWSAAPGGPPTGRFFTVVWPDGVQAQAITTGPGIGKGANITLQRADTQPFDLWSFTGKLLANTAGAGAQFEIMPQLNGNDALADPLVFDATGSAGQSFSHTPALSGYDTYKIHLWVDYAITALTLVDTNPVAPTGPTNMIAAFDFDTATPPVGPGQGMPATQSQNGVTAAFSTLGGSWSVQNTFYGWKPAVFSGNFLYPGTWGSKLAVEFSEPVTNFTMAFFTGEVASEFDTAALVRVTAYTNSAMTFPVASGSARGAWLTGAYPEGTLSFSSATPFTKVSIEVPGQSPVPSYLVFVDNLVVQTTAPTPANVPPLAFGGNFFQVAGQPLAINQGDLMWNDYDPDGSFVWFKGVGPTSSNGLVLATNDTQVLIPVNSMADSFTYTIMDSQGATASGTASITIITQVTCQAVSVDVVSYPGAAMVSFSGVPWYYFEGQRATNAMFTGTLRTWPVQSGPDGSFFVWDDFADLTNRPPEAYYRARYGP